MSNRDHNILLHFNAVDSLSYSGFQKRTTFRSAHAAGDADSLDFLTAAPEEEKKEAGEDAAEAKTDVAAVTLDLEKLML